MGVHSASVGGSVGGGRGGARTQAAHRGWRFLPLSRLAGSVANAIPVQPAGWGRGSLGILERTCLLCPERRSGSASFRLTIEDQETAPSLRRPSAGEWRARAFPDRQ